MANQSTDPLETKSMAAYMLANLAVKEVEGEDIAELLAACNMFCFSEDGAQGRGIVRVPIQKIAAAKGWWPRW
jgi:hypothetical protein